MFKSLRINNFKVWQDTGNIQMAPITLFFGTNSSGKSSIGQFLMMLKQTIESPDMKAVFYPGGKNSAVQLGSYNEMVFHRNPELKMSFEYQWETIDTVKIKDPLSGTYYSGDILTFNSQIGIYMEGNQKLLMQPLLVDNFKYIISDNVNNIIMSVGMKRSIESRTEYKVESSNYELKRKQGRGWSPGAPVRFYGFPNEVVAYHQNADFVQELNLLHEKLFRSLYYLGPLRTRAERLYSWTGIKPESVGYSGENTVAATLAARDRKISLGYRRPVRPFEEIIALKLKDMGLIDDFKVNQISEKRQDYEVKICTKGSKAWVDLPDVGIGVSQVLPVLVQCFYAPANSVIIMEQPEIHLHPSAQAALADVMIDVINSRENGKNRNIQLIIETHSEHFLRRLQRRIAEEEDLQNKVSAYFASVLKDYAKLESLQIDEYGNIFNWPENFFGDEMGDITSQAKAAIKKRSKMKILGEGTHNE